MPGTPETHFPRRQRGAAFKEPLCFHSVSPCWKHYTRLLLVKEQETSLRACEEMMSTSSRSLDRKSLCAATGVI